MFEQIDIFYAAQRKKENKDYSFYNYTLHILIRKVKVVGNTDLACTLSTFSPSSTSFFIIFDASRRERLIRRIKTNGTRKLVCALYASDWADIYYNGLVAVVAPVQVRYASFLVFSFLF